MFMAAFGILGIFGLAYFGVILLYSGPQTSVAWCWLVFADFWLLLAKGAHYYHHHRKQIPLWIPVSVATLCVTGLAVFIILQILIVGGMVKASPGHLDYLIVLGTKVREDDISDSLRRRLDKAIQYAQEHPETKLVLSGGQGADEPTTEAFAMAEYLRYNGVEPEQMLLEVYSTNTRENMICSKALIDDQRRKEKERAKKARIREDVLRMELDRFFLEREADREKLGLAPPRLNMRGPCARIEPIRLVPKRSPAIASGEILPDKPLQIGVLTSNFHLYRAMKIGEKCGFKQIYGVSSSTDPVLFIHLLVRESAAILKDKFMGNM